MHNRRIHPREWDAQTSQDETWLGEEGDQPGFVQIIEISPYCQRMRRKIFWDFEIQVYHLILSRRPDLVIVNKRKKKRTGRLVVFAVPADHSVKIKENRNRDEYLDFAMKHEDVGNTNGKWCTWNGPQSFGKRTRGVGNRRTDRDHPDYGIVEVGLNTEKRSEVTSVTWTPVKTS